MNNFARAHDRWLEPPDDDPICEDGCGETLYKHPWNDGWICTNKFCPTKFDGVEKKMAEALVDALEEIRTLKVKLDTVNRAFAVYVPKKKSGLE